MDIQDIQTRTVLATVARVNETLAKLRVPQLAVELQDDSPRFTLSQSGDAILSSDSAGDAIMLAMAFQSGALYVIRHDCAATFWRDSAGFWMRQSERWHSMARRYRERLLQRLD